MDTRKTHRTHECDREENHDDSGQQASGGEEEEMPAPQDPSWAPNERLGANAGLREAHSRLAELLLAVASILADITTSGGARTSTDIEKTRLADSRQNDFEVPAISAERTSIGGNGEQHVAGVLQSLPLTSSARDTGRHQPPTIGAAISQTDGAARESHVAEDDIIFQQRRPTLTAFKAEGRD
ncbi:unnamed protein product [Lampetra planeri]